MTDFGQSLREAREAKGITVGQLAETTKILPAVIEGLENDDFSRIAAPIYGRGFVKLYCEAVGLDAKPFIAEFMEIVNGNRETVIRERRTDADAVTEAPVAVPAEPVPPVATAEQPEAPVPEAPVPEAPVPEAPVPEAPAPVPRAFATAVEGDLFSEPPVSDPATFVRRETAPLPEAPSAPEATPVSQPTISRYASPFRMKSRPVVPPAFWRMSVLAVAGLLVLALVFCGLKALYRVTSNAGSTPADAIEQTETAIRQDREETRSDAAAETVSEPTPETATPVKRTPQKIPSLYID